VEKVLTTTQYKVPEEELKKMMGVHKDEVIIKVEIFRKPNEDCFLVFETIQGTVLKKADKPFSAGYN